MDVYFRSLGIHMTSSFEDFEDYRCILLCSKSFRKITTIYNFRQRVYTLDSEWKNKEKKFEVISRRLVVSRIKSGWVALAVDACNCKRRKRECAPASRVDKQRRRRRRRRRLTCSPPLRSRACLSDEYPGHVLGLATSVASRPPTFPDDLRAAILPATSPPAMHATPAYRRPGCQVVDVLVLLEGCTVHVLI